MSVWAVRLSRRWSLVAIVGVALTAGVGTYSWGSYQLRQARAALEQDRLAEALDHVQRCLVVWPRSPEAHLCAARVFRMLHIPAEAEKHLTVLRRLQGSTEESQLEWVLLKAQLGEFADVEKSLLKCVQENHPQSTIILESLATAYMRQLRFGDALGCLSELLKRNPDSVRALDWRCWIWERLENFEGANQDARRVLALSPTRWHVRLRLVNMLLAKKNTAEAAKHLAILRQSHGNNDEVLLALGRSEVLQGSTASAREFFEAAVEWNPKNANALYFRGQIDLDEGRPVEAEPWFRKAIEADGTHALARYSLYYAFQRQPDHQNQALENLASYKKFTAQMEVLKKDIERISRNPRDVRALIEVGEIFLDQGDNETARDFLSRSLKLDPVNRKAHKLLISYYNRKNQPDQAAAHRKFLATLPPE